MDDVQALNASEEFINEPKSKHPKGLWVLFGTEMWERFNFYGMRALLTLFMVNALMMQEADVSIIYGGFLALCYLTPMLGGFISDRFLGNRYSIIIGGSMMALGQLCMFLSATTFDSSLGTATTLMWVALGIIIFGNGFFKPNISSMVGSLYPKEEKSKLDSAFTIFYMGINLGAFLGQFICPILGDRISDGGIRDVHAFKWGFLAASCAMLFGTLFFIILKNKYVVTPEGRPIGGLPSKNTAADFDEGEAQKANFTGKSIGIAMALFVVGYLLFNIGLGQNVIYSLVYSAGIALSVLIILDSTLTKVERDRIFVIYIVSFFVIFFWAAFEQAGISLTFIANNQTDRNIFGWNMPPSMVQIFNGLFIVIMAVPFSMLWDKLREKGREPISPLKQALGLILIALSYFIIAYNVKDLGNDGLLAIKWLILLYFIQTCGELALSPIGLSLVGKLAPKRFASLLFGVFFIANAAGYALAGTLGSILPPTGDKFQQAEKQGVNLQAVLDKKYDVSGKDLFKLSQVNIAKVDEDKLKSSKIKLREYIEKNNKTLEEMQKTNKEAELTPDKMVYPTDAEMAQLKDQKIITMEYNKFAGFTIHNLFEFFMVFVVICGIAGILLALISPFLKKLMHGIR
ncbi:proton-dependent oligopeptide transporter, POT family [Halpernia humi]|uniref:Proton-dependent oligopeptide transporter, POT family n=1 Tax=Halpernia humi TaxID=493375 RepID=A0A1H6AK70_9FLAO|nr:peptide MFS transporter [Halpernia humi]SEG48802.1 proton-dependent oligopeptide transporter, POT family [Halpernia humi]